MINFNIFELSKLIGMYQDKYGLDDKEMVEKLDINYHTFYYIKYKGNLISRKKLQKSIDRLGLRFMVDGKEFRLEDYDSLLRDLAERNSISLNELMQDIGYSQYCSKTISVPALQYSLQGMGYKMYIAL